MWRTALATAAAAVALCSTGTVARADCLDIPDALHRVEATVQSVIGSFGGRTSADRDVIAPPAGIDPRMALVPPQQGFMRIVPPPASNR